MLPCWLLVWHFSSQFIVSCFLSFFPRAQILLPYKRIGRASMLHAFIPANFWAKVGLKVLFRIPSILANFAHFCWISFAFLYEISQPRYLSFVTYCQHFSSTTIYILQSSVLKLPSSQIILVIFPIPEFFAVFHNMNTSRYERQWCAFSKLSYPVPYHHLPVLRRSQTNETGDQVTSVELFHRPWRKCHRTCLSRGYKVVAPPLDCQAVG